MNYPLYHLIIYVPLPHADRIREVLAKHDAGKIGNYDSCSFSTKGIGRFRPLKGAKPAIGSEGTLEEVEEERIEVVVPSSADLNNLLRTVKEAHPYEEPAIHVLPMMDYRSFAD